MTRIRQARDVATSKLLAERNSEGFWAGELSSSAVSTATAASALLVNGAPQDVGLVDRALAWLGADQNEDGGWGDTPDSPSNLSTTLLALAALRLGHIENSRAEAYVQNRAPSGIPEAITAHYGADRTFAVPILMNCALAGIVPWSAVPGLPFELAVVPARFYRLLRLQVVSYALPALIAVGLVIDGKKGGRNPIHKSVVRAVLRKLVGIQPNHGGFLDAAPLTSFVAMSLAGRFGSSAPREASLVLQKSVEFLRQSVREDGSWPIDTDLSVWLTSSALNALHHTPSAENLVGTLDWLRDRQAKAVHPFTNSAPGGWPWTHREGGVPDADDTCGAVLALRSFGQDVQAGLQWLLDIQNEDGGWPTFCRGWGKLPFDQSSPDITAHALRALESCTRPEADQARNHGQRYLAKQQRPDGSWVPLWFGSQLGPYQTNPVLGTSRVLAARPHEPLRRAGMEYLLSAQNPDGSWGADRDVPGTIEETALAVIALCACNEDRGQGALQKGASRLAKWVESGGLDHPAPIGLYFASLWYSEKLYPTIWTVEALGRAVELMNPELETVG